MPKTHVVNLTPSSGLQEYLQVALIHASKTPVQIQISYINDETGSEDSSFIEHSLRMGKAMGLMSCTTEQKKERTDKPVSDLRTRLPASTSGPSMEVMVLTGSSCTHEAEAEGSMQIKGQPTLHSKLQAGGSCTWEDFMEEPGCVLS